ncbi:AAA family ATPase [Nonomuraea bangladeshensis]|uniref:AAA family ATPase n=1 Tax=Nonomuraea bangladeshensis TaxID=404385 RepID=UPI003C2C39F0
MEPRLASDHAGGSASRARLVIIDESERLTTRAIEQVRDFYDRSNLGLILIGMPGIDSAWPPIRSSTAISASSTPTAPWPPASSPSS